MKTFPRPWVSSIFPTTSCEKEANSKDNEGEPTKHRGRGGNSADLFFEHLG